MASHWVEVRVCVVCCGCPGNPCSYCCLLRALIIGSSFHIIHCGFSTPWPPSLLHISPCRCQPTWWVQSLSNALPGWSGRLGQHWRWRTKKSAILSLNVNLKVMETLIVGFPHLRAYMLQFWYREAAFHSYFFNSAVWKMNWLKVI